jgi:hypothetical protein
MNKVFLSVLAFIALAFSLASGCNEETKTVENIKQGFEAATSSFQPDTLPADATTASVDFRDKNTYNSGDYFCIVSIVDNRSINWCRLWVKVEVLDSMGNVLTVKGDSSFILRAFSDAVPPNGATSLFCAIPLADISGNPADCRLQGAGMVFTAPGPILIAPETSGVRVQIPDPDDSLKIKEIAFNLKTTVDNPLPMMAARPHLVLLLYGRDNKLYFAQVLDMFLKPSSIQMQVEGPLQGGEKREVRYPILYDYLPQQLKDNLIGRIDVQVFEGQEGN